MLRKLVCLVFALSCLSGHVNSAIAATITATDYIDFQGSDAEETLALDPGSVNPADLTIGDDDLVLSGQGAFNSVPLTLEDAQALEPSADFEEGSEAMPFDIRKEAIKEAAISYGARAGLSYRTYYIRREMDRRARSMDRIYDFRQLLIPAPSGLLIEPPIINENVNAMIIEGDGQQAAVSDRIYNIMNNAKIVSTARSWRTYLERSWGEVTPPPDILRPKNKEERIAWEKYVKIGWKAGVEQANEIFQEDLNQLIADYEGMIRYRLLLSQGMVSAPYALQVDRGVTGGGDEMRVGDRAVQITGKPSLMTGYETWQPASR